MVGWHIQTVFFRLILHPSNEFLEGLRKVNGFTLHVECRDARVSCADCQYQISNALGMSLGIFKMLKAYILRVERGFEYRHTFE